MEQTFEVQPCGVKYICDTCGEGELLPNGKNDWSAEQKPFEHECTECGQKKMFSEKYPLVRYKNVDE
ncbi:hypothetical protein [Domibacillus aminovorans]|nr:hypothetical protein [Domibacillus aminovorans]